MAKHGRLIDADALIHELNNSHFPGAPYIDAGISIAIGKVLDAPTIEPERKTGKWIHGMELSREMIGHIVTAIFYEGWECSECHCLVEEHEPPTWNYCPNCGAKMEEKQ